MTQTRAITILGATGSVGVSTLNLIRKHPDRFKLTGMTAHTKYRELAQFALEFMPECVVIADERYYLPLVDALSGSGITVRAGTDALIDMARRPADCVVGAIVGTAGLAAVYAAVQAGQTIALANKEALVVAGHLIMPMLTKTGASILPIDSEHSAVFQCLKGENAEHVEAIVLTASGGPFRELTRKQMEAVTPKQALLHPNWSMGPKVTIDSATLMNKGLELLEAKWLFNLPAEKIEAIIHPQSIIHGLVHFYDGSCTANLGAADMRIPISYALGYPDRLAWQSEKLDLVRLAQLDFTAIDTTRFPCFALARKVMTAEPEQAIILNTANEIAVADFLNNQLSYTGISAFVEEALSRFSGCVKTSSLEDVLALNDDIRHQLSIRS